MQNRTRQPACEAGTRGPDAVKLTACALRLRVGRPIGGASGRHRMEPSSSPAGGAGRGSVRPVSLHVVAGFGGRWRRELALLRGHSSVGSRAADPGGAAVAALARRLGEGRGMWWSTGRTGRLEGREEGGGQARWVREAEKERGGPENK